MPPVCPAYGWATPDLRPTKPAILRVADRPSLLSRDSADLVKRLERLDFRSESLGPTLRAMALDAERTIRRLARAPRA